MRTPWGSAQSIDQIASGVQRVHTASHGGYKLDRQRNNKIPKPFRRPAGWYEEDVESYIVDFFLLAGGSMNKVQACQVLKDNWPAAWVEYSGQVLSPAESRALREEEFVRLNANRYVSIAAFGESHPKVPKGMVGLCASLGGRRILDDKELRYFLVPDASYVMVDGHFVIPEDAQSWSGPNKT